MLGYLEAEVFLREVALDTREEMLLVLAVERAINISENMALE